MLGTYALSAGYYEAYYGQAQKVRTLIDPRLRGGVRDVRRARVADVAHHRVPDRREGRRPAGDVPERHLHDPGEPRGRAGDQRPVRPGRCRPAGRAAVHRARARRAGAVPRGARARAGPRARSSVRRSSAGSEAAVVARDAAGRDRERDRCQDHPAGDRDRLRSVSSAIRWPRYTATHRRSPRRTSRRATSARSGGATRRK